jgi:uncharacterized membrane protein (UPF0182 family)
VSMRPLPSVILSRRAKIALSTVAIVIVLLIVLVKLSGVYVNYLWFGQPGVDQRHVYSTILWTKVSLFFIFGTLMAVIIGGNLVIAYMLRPPFRPMSQEQQNLQNYVLLVEPRRKLILAGVMILTLLSAGASAQGDWAMWQLWLHGGKFGIPDPQFHRDISFYAWDYPVYRSLLGFGFTAILVSLILVIGVHYLTGAIRLQTPGPKVTLAARRHLTVLVFVFMALKAIAYWLDRYGLVFSTRSKFTGASYTDVHSALPARTILFWLAIILALGVLASMWLRSVLLPGIGFAVLLVLSILISGIYPAIVQQVSVKPNASDKERTYISRNIENTKAAYGVVTKDKQHPKGTVSYQDYAATSTPTVTDATQTSNPTVDNIRILDPNIISPTFRNFQKIGLPYGFSPTLDVDRYTLTDPVTKQPQTHDYIVAVREQVTGSNLTGSQDNWINQHTVYTHGYGFVAAEADKDVTNADQSAFTEGKIPPEGPLKLTQPDVYYGQLMNDYSIVGAKGQAREYDANGGNNVTYQGKGGISLSNPLTKLAFAFKYKETNFILNGAVGASGAKLINVRDPKTRLEKVAPFLTVDSDPYPIVDQATGHVVWMLDGYTTMSNYPYSERRSLSDLTHTSLQQGQKDRQINYIRNSVKATVDAYDGTVTLYQWDSSDPVLRAWMNIFPGLVQPRSEMPPSIASHVRYPQDLFDVQRGLLAQYHITDPVDSYNGKGKWQVPDDPFLAAPQPPYYVLAAPPGQDAGQPEFQLTTPMVVPGGTNNLAAYMSVDSDNGPNYGKITVLTVPTQSNIDGPSQIGNIFTSEGVISEDISLLGTGQSRVLHGNLLTLPVGNSFLYVEPLYVQGTGGTSSFPTLQRVLVTYGVNKGYAETLSAALDDLTTPGGLGASINQGQTSGNGTPTPPSSTSNSSSTSPSSGATSAPPPSTSLNRLLDELATARDALNSAYNTHDPTQIAQAQARVDDLVNQILDRTSSPPKATPSPGSS